MLELLGRRGRSEWGGGRQWRRRTRRLRVRARGVREMRAIRRLRVMRWKLQEFCSSSGMLSLRLIRRSAGVDWRRNRRRKFG